MNDEIVIRLATDEDVTAINNFYNSVYHSNRDKLKFDWEYNSSPAGKSIYVIAECSNEIIGTQCVIPYYLITSGNQVILSGKSEDTLVSPKHRGKQIFERMYSLLIQECKKNKINYIWGFTYAVKPFARLNFEIPFHSKMGVFVLQPKRAWRYFVSLSPKKGISDSSKKALLSIASFLKAKKNLFIGTNEFIIDREVVNLNSAQLNYLESEHLFGLKLDKDFINYRIKLNPYNTQYNTLNYKKDGCLHISVTYNINAENVGYLIHMYVSQKVSREEFSSFFKHILNTTELRKCHTLRFWGFGHNSQNQREIEMLSNCGFTFVNRGISFVWLTLSQDFKLNAKNFVLSRMASQGTD